jgi:hypothetical protein
MCRGIRFRMPVNEFAIPRMEFGKQRPIGSLEEARDWERHFIGEIKAGRDRRRRRSPRKSSDAKPTDVAGFLDTYMDRCVKPAALKSLRSICSRVAVLKENLGELPVDSLEEADDINHFKTESEYAEEVELAAMHCSLETLRAAMNWGMAQTPPLVKRSPFHRFGVRLNKKAETMRDRRLLAKEEKLLLDTSLQKMNVAEPSALNGTRRFSLSFAVAPGMPIWQQSECFPGRLDVRLVHPGFRSKHVRLRSKSRSGEWPRSRNRAKPGRTGAE